MHRVISPRLFFLTVFAKSSVLALRFSAATMAWHCSGLTNKDLVANLYASGIIASLRVRQAMEEVDRGDFVAIRNECAYEDAPQPIGYGATISAPHMHAYCLGALEEKLIPGATCLDVGSGSGIFSAYLAKMVGPTGRVVGIEHIPDLVGNSIRAMKRHNDDLLKSGRVTLLQGDGRLGHAEHAPYDVIHVGAAVTTDMSALRSQLKVGGRLVAPVGDAKEQTLMQIDRVSETGFVCTELMGVRYVPLTDRAAQLRRM